MFPQLISGRRPTGDNRRAKKNGRRASKNAQRAGKTRQGRAKDDSGQKQFAAQAFFLAKTVVVSL